MACEQGNKSFLQWFEQKKDQLPKKKEKKKEIMLYTYLLTGNYITWKIFIDSPKMGKSPP